MSSPVLFLKGTTQVSAKDFLPTHVDIVGYNDLEARVFQDHDLQFESLLNPREKRIYSRRVLWMFEALFRSGVQDKIREFDPYRVGIYVAGPGHVIPWKVFKSRQTESTSIYKSMRQNYFPKHSLKFNLGIAPAHLSIFFNIRGPTNAFINSVYSCQQAFERANLDLKTKTVDLALVLGVNVFEDPFHFLPSLAAAHRRLQNGQERKDICPSEAVLCRILSEPAKLPDLDEFLTENEREGYFGVMEGLRAGFYY